MQKARDLTDGTLRRDVDEILADDRFGGVILRATPRRDGKQMDVHMADAIRFGDDGRWSEFWALSDDQSAVDAFWR